MAPSRLSKAGNGKPHLLPECVIACRAHLSQRAECSGPLLDNFYCCSGRIARGRYMFPLTKANETVDQYCTVFNRGNQRPVQICDQANAVSSLIQLLEPTPSPQHFPSCPLPYGRAINPLPSLQVSSYQPAKSLVRPNQIVRKEREERWTQLGRRGTNLLAFL